MADQEQKAIEFIQQAEKKLKSSSGFLGSLLGFAALLYYVMQLLRIYVAPSLRRRLCYGARLIDGDSLGFDLGLA